MALAGLATGVAISYVGGQLKPPTERIYGKLPGTLVELQEGVEGKIANLNNRTYNDVQTVELMDTERRKDDGMAGIWKDLLPNWSPTPAALAEIRRRDPAFVPRGGTGGAGSTGGTPDTTPGSVAPAQTGKEAPAMSRASAGGIIGTLPLWATLALAGAIGYVAFKAIKK